MGIGWYCWSPWTCSPPRLPLKCEVASIKLWDSREVDMNWFDRDVHGGETFYQKAALRSGFFMVDTLLLMIASFMSIYILVSLSGGMGFLGKTRLVIVLLGMWLLWGNGWATHRRIRALDQSDAIKSKPLDRVAASVTHMGMFVAYLLITMLLVEIGSLLRHAS
jgi:hypothetical protein